MLRRIVLLLLVLNLGVWAWSQGLLSDLGLGPTDEREPERLQRQIQPERLRVGPLPVSQAARGIQAKPEPPLAPPPSLPPESLEEEPVGQGPDESEPGVVRLSEEEDMLGQDPAAIPASPVALRCLETGPFNEAQADILRRELASWTAGSWQLQAHAVPGRWMVLLRLPDAEAVRLRRAELRERGIDVDQPGAAFEPGLSLGRFSTAEAARQGLSDLGRRGVQGLQVAMERKEVSIHVLRLPQANETLQEQAQAAISRLGVQRSWTACD